MSSYFLDLQEGKRADFYTPVWVPGCCQDMHNLGFTGPKIAVHDLIGFRAPARIPLSSSLGPP